MGDTQDNVSLIFYRGAEEPQGPVRPRFLRHRGNAQPVFTHSPPFDRWLLRALQDPEISTHQRRELLQAMAPDVARWADDYAPALWAYLDAVVAPK